MDQIDVVRIGVLGCGYWGPNHIRNFLSLRQLGAEMLMAADPDPSRRHHVAGLYPSIEVVADSREVVHHSDIDAVVIATPVSMHFELARQALDAGKHVLVEKPFTTSLAEATELAHLAKENERVLMVGHTFEYAEAVGYIRRAVREGELGNLTYIRSLRLNLGLFRSDINVLWDLAPHDLSILLYVLERFPRTVQATAMARVNRSVEDVASVTLDFGDQLMANIIVSWLDPQKVREMTFVGDRKMLVYNDVSTNEKIRIFDKGIAAPRHYDSFGEFQYSYRYGDILIPMLDEREPLFTECRHFLECCQLGKEPRSGAGAGAAVTAIIEAAQQSIRQSGKPIELDVFGVDAPFEEWRKPGGRQFSDTGERSSISVAGTYHAANTPVKRAGREKPERLKAIVIDPKESGRVFAANALSSFEPSFDVVTVAGVDGATEWIGSFVPDLLVVSEAVDEHQADDIVAAVLKTPRGRHCKVVSVGHVGSDDTVLARWRHASLNDDSGLAEWLMTIRHVLDR